MGYVGNQTTNSYSSLAKQTITGDGGTSYTLDHAVANAQEVEIFVNNVRQEPGVAYTVNGTALTMTGNVAASDDFYVVFQGKALQTVTPPDLSVTTAKIVDANVTTAKIADDAVTAAKVDSTLHLSTIKDSAGTNTALTIDSTGRILTPARPSFLVGKTSAQSITSSGRVLVTLTDTITQGHNTGGHWSNSNSRFTAPVAGVYVFSAQLQIGAHSTGDYHLARFEKNGTAVNPAYHINYLATATHYTASFTIPLELAANDYIDLHTQSGGDSSYNVNDTGTFLSGFLLG